MSAPPSLIEHFADLPDPRMERTRLHALTDILVIAICAIVCGAEDFVAFEAWGRAQEAWLRQRLPLPNGIPSHDTFDRVFRRLDPEAFSRCFRAWVDTVREVTAGEVIAFDGKTVRRSFDRASGKAAIHMVSAWATQNRLVLGQVKVDDKSNEITALPALLRLLDINGCVVTIDAMGCQKAIARQIVEQGGDYLLALKENQPSLYADVVEFFTDVRDRNFAGVPHGYHREFEGDHGRVETRCCFSIADLDWLRARHEEWLKLTSIALVERPRQVGEKKTVEVSYYISSLGGGTDPAARRIGGATRGHWGIENRLHWVLDVDFGEDRCRTRCEHAAQNLALLRHIGLNLLQQEQQAKLGIKNKRLRAGWDTRYLEKVLTGF
jgi:predicted transposase YbfD/YdcC